MVVYLGIVPFLIGDILLANTYSSKVKSPQYLPLEAQWCLPNKDCILLEIADNNHEKQLGLMHRISLDKGTGMWFKFVPSEIVRFWMFETIMPLDMIFLYNGIVVSLETNVEPCSLPPCPTFGPNLLVDGVIEIVAGEVDRLKIKVGDAVEINYFEQ